jgi:hypothetical protein
MALSTTFIHDFNNYGPAEAVSRQSRLGTALLGSDRLLLSLPVPTGSSSGPLATEEDAHDRSFPPSRKMQRLRWRLVEYASVLRLPPRSTAKATTALSHT